MVGFVVIKYLERKMKAIAASRDPDYMIHPDIDYIRRWHIIPKNKYFNIYLHRVNASDDDRALHDHPWHSCSIILDGAYLEVLSNHTHVRATGNITVRTGSQMHRLEIKDGPVWSLFITGPKYREWGFADPSGWVHNRMYTNR